MKPGSSLLCSQVPITGSYPESDEGRSKETVRGPV
jgi:hypothetical protein